MELFWKKNDFNFTKMHLYELCFSFHFEWFDAPNTVFSFQSLKNVIYFQW